MRFDKAFTQDLADDMAAAGCIAVTGGLEIASDRLLALMEKGTTVEQVAQVCRAFKHAKIAVHAYLMYGFPTETDQEIMDSLEVVRQFFQNGLLSTATWHRFITTSHSPIGRNPERYGITLKRPEPSPHGVFSSYVIPHETDIPNRYDQFGPWLAQAVRNYEQGIGIDAEITTWFKTKTPVPSDDPSAGSDRWVPATAGRSQGVEAAGAPRSPSCAEKHRLPEHLRRLPGRVHRPPRHEHRLGARLAAGFHEPGRSQRQYHRLP